MSHPAHPPLARRQAGTRPTVWIQGPSIARLTSTRCGPSSWSPRIILGVPWCTAPPTHHSICRHRRPAAGSSSSTSSTAAAAAAGSFAAGSPAPGATTHPQGLTGPPATLVGPKQQLASTTHGTPSPCGASYAPSGRKRGPPLSWRRLARQQKGGTRGEWRAPLGTAQIGQGIRQGKNGLAL